MAYESKKKLRKTWRDDSTIYRQNNAEVFHPKQSGGLMGGWPEAWKNLSPPPKSYAERDERWSDIVSSFSTWKYGKVHGPFS